MDIEVLYGAKCAAAGVSPSVDAWTLFAHGLSTGQKVWVASDGALPTPLKAQTDYWAIALDSDSVQLAASEADARAGTSVDLSDAGKGEHTLLFRHRVDVERVAEVPKDRVLLIALSAPHPTAPRYKGNARVAEAYGKDFYFLAHQYRDSDRWYMLAGHDAREMTEFHRVDQPFAATSLDVLKCPPFRGLAATFTGYAVSDAAWADALALADAEVH